MFSSRGSNLLLSGVLQVQVAEADTFRSLRESRYSSLEGLFRKVERNSMTRRSPKTVTASVITAKMEPAQVSSVMASRAGTGKTRATSIKLMKQLALQSTDERKERVIKRRGFERQKRMVLSELKASLEQKTQDQAQKLSQMRSQVDRVDGILKKLINTQMIVSEEETNPKMKHLLKLQREEEPGIVPKQLTSQEVTQRLQARLPRNQKGSMLDPSKYQQLYDAIYQEKANQLQQNQKVSRNILYDKARSQNLPFKGLLSLAKYKMHPSMLPIDSCRQRERECRTS